MRPQSRTIRCAIYTRKSTEEGLEQDYNSLHAQRDACAAYVQSQAGEGWSLLPEVYDDGGFSGGTMERPALKRLMADIQAGRVDVVVVYKVDRLTRALTDFSKIVDVLDKAGASFVSVTQAFNTTTSMGRLTLNVLLSFAQFEREVTGERIRDKIAASKKLGMWMGGSPVLGYDPHGRTLQINPAEAEIIRQIFDRYLALGSVNDLSRELKAQGVVSKQWTSQSGIVRGGVPIERGALYHILKNRLYIGEIPHKGESHPGQHPAIIDRDVFDAAQVMLAKTTRRPRRTGEPRREHSGAPLMGIIHDSAGNVMSPVSVRRKGGVTYRYYVSTALQSGVPETAGSHPRVSAPVIESLVARAVGDLMERTGDPDWALFRDLLDRVEIRHNTVCIHVDLRRVEALADALPRNMQVRLAQLEREGDAAVMRVAVTHKKRGSGMVAIGVNGASAMHRPPVDPALSSALVRAESWKRKLVSGEAATLGAIAQEEGLAPGYAARLIRVGFLAPDLKRAVLDGRHADHLTLQAVLTEDLPIDWAEQRRLYAA